MGCNRSGSSVQLMVSEIAPQSPVQVVNCKEISTPSLPSLPLAPVRGVGCVNVQRGVHGCSANRGFQKT